MGKGNTENALGGGGSRGTGECGNSGLFPPYLPGLSLNWIRDNTIGMIFAILPALGP